jgi:hypothetical protein
VRRDSAGVQESRSPLRIRELKFRKGSAFTRISETQVEGSQRRRNAKAKPLRRRTIPSLGELSSGGIVPRPGCGNRPGRD